MPRPTTCPDDRYGSWDPGYEDYSSSNSSPRSVDGPILENIEDVEETLQTLRGCYQERQAEMGEL